jgi:hypothetical protein
MNGRGDIVGVIGEALALVEELSVVADRAFAARPEAENAELVATIFGVRARNALRAMNVLAGEGVDDQVAILGRTLTEAVLDLQYLRTYTVRRVDGQAVPLRTTDKEDLFLTSMIIAENRIRGSVVSVPKEELQRAQDLRKQLRLKPSAPYWHGANTERVLQELQASVTGPHEVETLKNAYYVFRLLSLNTHSSPQFAAYFEEAPGGGWPLKVKAHCSSDEILAMCVLLAVHILRMWGDALSHDVSERALQLIMRLPRDEEEVNTAQPSAAAPDRSDQEEAS